jgi:hypothetical protein
MAEVVGIHVLQGIKFFNAAYGKRGLTEGTAKVHMVSPR